MKNVEPKQLVARVEASLKLSLHRVGRLIYCSVLTRTLVAAGLACTLWSAWEMAMWCGVAFTPIAVILVAGVLLEPPKGKKRQPWPPVTTFQWLETTFERIYAKLWPASRGGERASPYAVALLSGIAHGAPLGFAVHVFTGFSWLIPSTLTTLLWAGYAGRAGCNRELANAVSRSAR